MTSKDIKKCSTSHVIREMRIKTTRHHYTPVRMSQIWNTDNTNCWVGRGATETLIYCEWERKMLQRFGNQFSGFLPYSLAIALLVIYLKELKTYVYVKTCT